MTYVPQVEQPVTMQSGLPMAARLNRQAPWLTSVSVGAAVPTLVATIIRHGKRSLGKMKVEYLEDFN